MKALKKIGKIFLYIIAGIIILLFVVGLFIDPIAKNVLENQVSKADEGQFSLSLDDVDISILGGNFRLEGVLLETDTANPATPPIVHLKANEIAVEGVSWLNYLLTSKLQMDEVLLDNFDVELFARSVDTTQQQQKETGPFNLQQLDIYPMIKDQIDRFRLKDLNLNDISLTLVNLSTNDTLAFNSEELNFQSDDILIDADKLITDNRAFYATEMDFEGKGVRIVQSGNKALITELDYIKFETRDDKIGLLSQEVNFLQSGDQISDTLMSVVLGELLLSDLEMKPIEEDSIGKIERFALKDLNIVNNIPASPDTSMVSDTAQQQMNLAELSLGESLPEFLKAIELEELELSGISYRQGNMMRLEEANFLAGDIEIDENSAFSHNRFFHAENVESSFDLFALSMEQDSVHVTAAGFQMNIENGVGSMGLQEIMLRPGDKEDDEMWIDAEVGPLRIVGLNTRNIPEQKSLSIDSIGLASPVLVVNMPPQNQNNTGNNKNANNTSNMGNGQGESPSLNLYPAIEGILASVHLRKLAIIDADVKASGLLEGSEQALHIPSIFLQISDVLIAEGTAFSDNRVLHSDDIALRVEGINVPMNDMYDVNLDLLRLSTRESFVEANNFSFEYSGERGEIPQKADTGTVMSLKNEKFLVRQLDWNRLLDKNSLEIGLIRSEGLELYMFVDNNKSNQTDGGENASGNTEASNKGGNDASMPQEMIKQVEMPFNLKKLEVEGAKFTYEELASGAEETGLAEITDVSVVAANITNIERQLKEKPKLPIELTGKIMGTGSFGTRVVLDMVSDSNLVVVEGQLDTLDITKMNQFTEFTSRIGFESGEIYQLGWDIQMDDEEASGTLEMSYDDLKIQISESNNPSTSGILKNAGSFLANNLVLESDVAPESSEEPKEAEFSEERNSDNFPAYVIQGLISGFMELMVTIF